MPSAHSTAPRSSKPLRLWPGVAGACLVVAGTILGAFPAVSTYGMIGSLAGALVVLLWWLFFSRAPWLDRLIALPAMAAAVFLVRPMLDPSISGAGMGRFFYFAAVPMMTLGLAVWAGAVRGRTSGAVRPLTMLAAVVIGCCYWLLIRTDGVSGEGGFIYHLRWTPTAEDKLLAQAEEAPTPLPPPASAPASATVPAPAVSTQKPVAAPPAPAAVPAAPSAAPEWPGFRGPKRDAVVPSVRLNTDWNTSPPKELWHRRIGPGWSSFAVHGDLLYTQEQRGAEEIVACYRVSTGAPVWRHKDAARFYESNGGPGPRATPTLANGRVYAFGATGILNALEATTGARIWSRSVATDTDTAVPMWGFTSSPIIVDDLVIVAASSKLAAYEHTTGKPRWSNPGRQGSYSSPHLATIDGVVQVLFISGSGAVSVAPATGAVLWEHAWGEGTTVVQPALTPDGDILINAISMMGGLGLRRLHPARDGNSWKVEERWTSNGLKPYFNDFVVHQGHAYGFDGNILSSINLTDGKRNWKGGRYGAGQLLLLPAQDLLLIIAEEGDLALVSASPDKFTEIARVPGIEGKTWNHPVLIGDILLVRNGEEMAAFRLALQR
jgi:outer membrane protein assembly factor BamB